MSIRTLECRALLFDMDGVLVDSTRHVDHVWRMWARDRGVDEDAVMAIAHGRRSIEVIQSVAPHLATPEEVIAVEEMESGDVAPVDVQPGATELLASLPAGTWAVVTSASADLARERLRTVGLPEPRVLVSGDDVVDGKPDPAPYLAAARALGVAPAECVVFEDTPPGIESGRRAGMTVVALTTTFPPEVVAAADVVAANLAAVKARVTGSGIELRVESL